MNYRVTTKWANNLANEIVIAAHGRGGPNALVQTEEDWKVVLAILNICAKYFPKEIHDYLELNKAVKLNQKNQYGLLEDPETKKGGAANVRQTGTWPFEFETLVRVVWPNQRMDKKFTRELFRRFPMLRTAEKL